MTSREMPLPPEAIEILEKQLKRFKEKFGRDCGEGDPVFFDPNKDKPEAIDPKAYHNAMMTAFNSSGIRAVLIYAFLKTGRMVTETNRHFLTQAELSEWDAAFDEYKDIKKRLTRREKDKFDAWIRNHRL